MGNFHSCLRLLLRAARQERGVCTVEAFCLWVSGSPILGVLFFRHDFPKLKKHFFLSTEKLTVYNFNAEEELGMGPLLS